MGSLKSGVPSSAATGSWLYEVRVSLARAGGLEHFSLEPLKMDISTLNRQLKNSLLEFYCSKDFEAISKSNQAELFCLAIKAGFSWTNLPRVSRTVRSSFVRALLGVGFCSKVSPHFRRAKACPACGSSCFDLHHFLRDCKRFSKDRSALLGSVLARSPLSALEFLDKSCLRKSELASLMFFLRRVEKYFESKLG